MSMNLFLSVCLIFATSQTVSSASVLTPTRHGGQQIDEVHTDNSIITGTTTSRTIPIVESLDDGNDDDDDDAAADDDVDVDELTTRLSQTTTTRPLIFLPPTYAPINTPPYDIPTIHEESDDVDGDDNGDDVDHDQSVATTTASTPECLAPDGTFVNWLDDTCRSYMVCRDSHSVLETCPDGEVFSGLEGSCVTRTIFNCDITNEAMKIASDALSFFRGSVANNLLHRIRRSADAKDGDTFKETDFEIALPEVMCELISWNTDFLETNMNNLINVNSKCPKGSACRPPKLSFKCDESDDDEEEDEDDDNDQGSV